MDYLPSCLPHLVFKQHKAGLPAVGARTLWRGLLSAIPGHDHHHDQPWTTNKIVGQTFPQSLTKHFGVCTQKAQGRQLPIVESFHCAEEWSCSPIGKTRTYAHTLCMQKPPHTHTKEQSTTDESTCRSKIPRHTYKKSWNITITGVQTDSHTSSPCSFTSSDRGKEIVICDYSNLSSCDSCKRSEVGR